MSDGDYVMCSILDNGPGWEKHHDEAKQYEEALRRECEESPHDAALRDELTHATSFSEVIGALNERSQHHLEIVRRKTKAMQYEATQSDTTGDLPPLQCTILDDGPQSVLELEAAKEYLRKVTIYTFGEEGSNNSADMQDVYMLAITRLDNARFRAWRFEAHLREFPPHNECKILEEGPQRSREYNQAMQDEVKLRKDIAAHEASPTQDAADQDELRGAIMRTRVAAAQLAQYERHLAFSQSQRQRCCRIHTEMLGGGNVLFLDHANAPPRCPYHEETPAVEFVRNLGRTSRVFHIRDHGPHKLEYTPPPRPYLLFPTP